MTAFGSQSMIGELKGVVVKRPQEAYRDGGLPICV